MKFNNYEYDPKMSPEEFEQANTDGFQQIWVESNPELAYKINDGDLEAYDNDIDRSYIYDIMGDCYVERLSENF